MASTEYICAQCWHSFEAEDTSESALTCPSCGAEQPNAGAAGGAEEPVAETSDEGPAIPDVQVEDAEETPAADVEEEVNEEEESAPADDWASLDPNKCGWRVRSGGLTYNFHGVNALQNWCSGKKGLDAMEVSIEDKDLWRNLQEFRRLLRKQDPIEAYRTMGGDVVEEEPVKEAKAPMEPKPAKPTRAKESEPAPSKTRSSSDSSGSSGKASKPSVRTTGEFTFRVGEAPAAAGKNWTALGGGFVIGLLFGLALYFLGVLSALDIEPLLSLGGGN